MYNIKRGDTFIVDINLKDSNQNALDLEVDKIKSQIRLTNGELLSDVEITKNGVGMYQLKVADTTNWVIGIVEMDIEMTIGDVIKSSETININVLKDITR